MIIVNETMAKKYWTGTSAVGRRMAMGGNGVWLTVVGVVADVHHRGLDMLPRPEMYRAHTQFRYGGADAPAVSTMSWVVRTSGDPLAATSYARAAIHAVDPSLGISDVTTMDQVLADSTSDRRLNMLLFALLGSLALALATVGVYGVVAYSVSQRTHEIGVRVAIGASPADVVRMVLSEGGRLAIIGRGDRIGDGLCRRAADSRAAVRRQPHRPADVCRRRDRFTRSRARSRATFPPAAPRAWIR